jgi:hypothetical protein
MTRAKFNDFINYVWEFYNPENGLYPMADLTRSDVELATYIRIGKCSLNKIDFVGDTFDREAVRDFLIDEFMYTLD